MKLIRKVKAMGAKWKEKWNAFKERNYSNTEKSKVWLFNILTCTIIGSLFLDSGLPQIVSFLLFGALGYLIINLLRVVITLLLKPLLQDRAKPAVYTVMLVIFIFFPIYAGSFLMSMTIVLVISMLIAFIEIIFARSLWSFFCHRRKNLAVILSFSLTLLFNIALSGILLGEGFQDGYIEQYEALGNSEHKNVSATEKVTLENGSLSVSHVEYGLNSDDGLETETTDLSSYIGEYEGITSMLRGMYWGYGIDEVPLTGKVWYPTQGENYPVMFIIHGNHNMTTKSYLGYDYLGEYLASNGYVVVSVDEAFCNGYINMGLSNENDARAILLLENMQLVERYNLDPEGPLYQKIDFSNVALAGHSRGGESIATAALFNDYTHYPDNGNIRFNYHFNIKSLIAISPTVDQYQPAQHEVELTDINYLLIHGSNDQDVTDVMGYSQYHNITFDKDSGYFKAFLYIAGANHGQFNTQWGRYDLPQPFKPFLNTKNLLGADEQRNILKAYTKEFLDATLKQEKASTDFFANQESKYELANTLYMRGYQDSTFDLITNFDEDSNIKYGPLETTRLDANHMSVWRELKSPIYDGEDDYVLKLVWNNTEEAEYMIYLPARNASEEYLQFDIMDIGEKNYQEEDFQSLDARITLEDSHGNKSSLQMSDYITVYPTLPVRQFKLQYLTNTFDDKNFFQTVRFSCTDFEKNNQDFDSTSIVKIGFEFSENKKGSIMLDNVGFGR